MPGLSDLEPEDEAPEVTDLRLPSSLSASKRRKICSPGVIEAETELRHAFLGDMLEDLLRYLRMRSMVNHGKVRFAKGVAANTRFRTAQDGVDKRILSTAAAYQRHREAYLRLAGPGDWERHYRPLSKSDLRGLNEAQISDHELAERDRIVKLTRSLVDKSNGKISVQDAVEQVLPTAPPSTAGVTVGEGKRTISWVWLVGAASLNLDDVETADCTSCLNFFHS
jgi:hypothetical protein